MSRRQQRIDAVGLRKTGKASRQIEDLEGGAASLSGSLPCEEHGERRRIELRKRRAIDSARARGNPLETRRKRGIRARVGQRRATRKTICDGAQHFAHDCLPAASCWLRCVRNWISPSTPFCWICSLNCC